MPTKKNVKSASSRKKAARTETGALLRDLGADEATIEEASARVDEARVQKLITRFRAFAEENPRVVLGALSALVAGGAVVAGHALASKKEPAAAPKTAAKSGRKSTKSTPRKRSASTSKSKGASKSTAAQKRTLIEPHAGDKRYIRRDEQGRIKESVDVGRSLSADRKRSSQKRVKPGQGDKGDR